MSDFSKKYQNYILFNKIFHNYPFGISFTSRPSIAALPIAITTSSALKYCLFVCYKSRIKRPSIDFYSLTCVLILIGKDKNFFTTGGSIISLEIKDLNFSESL